MCVFKGTKEFFLIDRKYQEQVKLFYVKFASGLSLIFWCVLLQYLMIWVKFYYKIRLGDRVAYCMYMVSLLNFKVTVKSGFDTWLGQCVLCFLAKHFTPKVPFPTQK